MENWRSYRGLPCVLDRVKTTLRFLLFLILRVKLFCQIHGLMDFLNEHMETDGLQCILDRDKRVSV